MEFTNYKSGIDSCIMLAYKCMAKAGPAHLKELLISKCLYLYTRYTLILLYQTIDDHEHFRKALKTQYLDFLDVFLGLT